MVTLTIDERRAVEEHARATLGPAFGLPALPFADLPLMDRRRMLPFYNLPPRAGQRSFSSTGTSGNPKKINWSDAEDEWYIADKGAVIVPFLETCRRVFISLGVGHGAGSSTRVFEGTGIDCRRVGVGDVGGHLDELRGFGPDALYCSPSLLTGLLTRARGAGRPIAGVRRVVLNGEVVHRAMIDLFCRDLGITPADILDTYGTTEAGTIACSCARCGRYHFMPGIVPEAVPAAAVADCLPVAEEVLVLSSLKRTSFPLLRFVTYDLVRGLGRTVCRGVEGFSYERIIGRADDVLNYGELFPAADLIDLIKRHHPGRDWLIFNYHNDIDIVIAGEPVAAFTAGIGDLYPVIGEMVAKGMLAPWRVHYRSGLADLRAREGLTAPGAKEGQRIVKRRFDD